MDGDASAVIIIRNNTYHKEMLILDYSDIKDMQISDVVLVVDKGIHYLKLNELVTYAT